MTSRPMRVAHVIGKMTAGGVEAVVKNYYQHIDHANYQFDIFYDDDSTVQPPQQLIDMGARFIQVPRYQKLSAFLRALIQAFRQEKYEIVHSHLNTLSMFSLYAAWRAGVPIRIAHSHSTIRRGEGKRTWFKYLLRMFSKLFATDYAACSLAAAESLFGKRSVEQKRVWIFRNAIDTSRYSFQPDVRAQMRRKLALDNDLVIGHVGRFVYTKNHLFLLDMFAELHQKHAYAKLVLIGDGPLLQEAKDHAALLRVQEDVLFLGSQKSVWEFYQVMDVFVLPSFYEGLPVVLVEAQTSGLPILASNNVSPEAFLTPKCRSMPLSASASEWALTIERLAADQSPRSMGAQCVAQAGYEIADAAKELAQYYDDLRKKITHSKAKEEGKANERAQSPIDQHHHPRI